jgi:hypothetical protein
MAAPNTQPIFTRQGDVDGSQVFTTAAADYTGQGINNALIFTSDATNGSFVQRLRFKALGTNIATVARIYVNNGGSRFAPVITAVSGTPTGTPSPSGGTLYAGNFFAKIYAVDQFGSVTAASTETASVAVTGTTGSIVWNWTAVTGAVSYIIAVGLATNAQQTLFTSTTNSYTQTTPSGTVLESDITNNNYFYGEISLPATTASASSATVEIDYPMNFALKPGQNLVMGLGTTVAAGWVVTVIGGIY